MKDLKIKTNYMLEEQSQALDRIPNLEILSLEAKRNWSRFPKTGKMNDLKLITISSKEQKQGKMPEKTFVSDGFQGNNCDQITYVRNINETFDLQNLLAHVDCCPYKLIQLNIGTLVCTVHNG